MAFKHLVLCVRILMGTAPIFRPTQPVSQSGDFGVVTVDGRRLRFLEAIRVGGLAV